MIKNQYIRDPWDATQSLHLPKWGEKLLTPSFYKEEKFTKLMRHWTIRLHLETIKMRQAAVYRSGDRDQKQKFKEEIEDYLTWA